MGKFLPRKVFTQLVENELHPIKNGELTPQRVCSRPFSRATVWWLGECGHEWQQRIVDRYYGHKCPYCAGTRVLPGFNDLASTFPDVAATWHPTKNGDLTPQDVSCGSDRKVWWLGKCGHEWEARVRSRIKTYGCPVCRKIKRMEITRQKAYEARLKTPDASFVDNSTSLFQWACQQRHRRGVSYDLLAEQLGISRDAAKDLCLQDSSDVDELYESLTKCDAYVA